MAVRPLCSDDHESDRWGSHSDSSSMIPSGTQGLYSSRVPGFLPGGSTAKTHEDRQGTRRLSAAAGGSAEWRWGWRSSEERKEFGSKSVERSPELGIELIRRNTQKRTGLQKTGGNTQRDVPPPFELFVYKETFHHVLGGHRCDESVVFLMFNAIREHAQHLPTSPSRGGSEPTSSTILGQGTPGDRSYLRSLATSAGPLGMLSRKPSKKRSPRS